MGVKVGAPGGFKLAEGAAEDWIHRRSLQASGSHCSVGWTLVHSGIILSVYDFGRPQNAKCPRMGIDLVSGVNNLPDVLLRLGLRCRFYPPQGLPNSSPKLRLGVRCLFSSSQWSRVCLGIGLRCLIFALSQMGLSLGLRS